MSTAEKGHGITIVAYVLHLLGAITGILSIVALIINYVKRGDDGVAMDSHHSWMIRSFWWAILWCVLIGLSYFLLVGFVVGWIAFAIVWIWYIYRHVRGLLYLSEDRAMPA
ncbi:MAG: hypothetical protein KGL98_10150 [Gammaproteobacteria bacterium]|nr:hypothetical protein [Gammaproteobacteria bacterium]MBU6509021.1 hypothetical protein [Gammaproteobacteria bacterium]MDE1984041.1 hypothetical protein [Gammaproteobacteria bacterium]MDE2108905.1 hypothetical protein [Gammaproteobacteria bacterium]MDE2461595.1 hypothetical protein [Gammaproteobacteria bacterium]